jgi:hypothetical protein
MLIAAGCLLASLVAIGVSFVTALPLLLSR